MKKALVMIGVVGLGLMVLTGCGPMSYPPSAVGPAMILTDVNYPSMHDAQTVFNFSKSDFEILGPVSATSESESILGVVARGDNGYGKLMTAAKNAYPNADAVINVQWDTDFNSICLGLYSKVTSKVTGTAVKFKK